jgi:hypothetical protein
VLYIELLAGSLGGLQKLFAEKYSASTMQWILFLVRSEA